MRTTMDLPKDLLVEAKRIEHLRSLRGTLDLSVDLKRLRKDRTAAYQ